jgi:hypothetical protein
MLTTRVQCLCFAATLLYSPALFAASTQPTITDIHPIYASTFQFEQIRATSDFNCGFWNAASSKCTHSWTLQYVSPDPTLDVFTATWDAGGINLKATLGYNVAYSRTWVSDVPNGVKVAQPTRVTPGPITFSGIDGLPNTNAKVDYYNHPGKTTPTTPGSLFDDIKDALNAVGDKIGLGNEIVENPTLASFHSEVTLIADASYEYAYEVRNDTDSPIVFDWSDTGRSGTVDPNTVLAWSDVSSESPFAVYGTLDATVLGGEYSGPSTTILPSSAVPSPIPIPAPLLLLSTGLVTFGFIARKHRHRR